MIKRTLVQSAMKRICSAEAEVVAAMAENGIPGPMTIIHKDLECTLYSSEAVFTCGIRRPRLDRQITVPYGPKIDEAIAAAVRQGGALQ